ncbi:MAG TPA: hypothetical protein VGK63_00235 [Candidatus Limnocylindrales bacterium]
MADAPSGRGRRPVGPARHEVPAIDEAALVAARNADRLLAGAREAEAARWTRFLEPLPDQLRDDDVRSLRAVAARARAAYGPKDSIRDVLAPELTEPFLDSIDRLIRELARAAVRR